MHLASTGATFLLKTRFPLFICSIIFFVYIWEKKVMWFYYIMLSAWKKVFQNKDFDDERDESCPRNNSRANLLRLDTDKDKEE